VALVFNSAIAEDQLSNAWETCSVAEGKGDSCVAGDQPRRFDEFLVPGEWSNTRGDQFSSEFRWDISQPENSHFVVAWGEVGKLGTLRVRYVRYTSSSSVFAGLLVAETSGNKFMPLMKWSGQMPESAIHRADGIDVLVLSKDFGGNIPAVETWAWIWGAGGPVRLNLSAAVAEAIAKVAPGYSGYATGLDWNSLHYMTWVWKGAWPGKAGLSDAMEAWFKLGRDGLMVQRAEFREGLDANPGTVRWPR
jgi:hypothetical protein